MIRAQLVIHPSEKGEDKTFVELPRKDEIVRLGAERYVVKHIVHNLNTNVIKVMVKDIKHL